MSPSSEKKEPKELLDALFQGRKAKWLPLYRRFLARFSKLVGVEIFPANQWLGIGHSGDGRATIGHIRITQKGLDVRLGLTRSTPATDRLRPSDASPRWITHRVLVREASEIDEEFLSWIRAAKILARTARPRSA